MTNITNKKLVLIELNEINFDVVQKYIDNGSTLPAFSKILSNNLLNTYAEMEYKNLEPWIQWPSVHTGKEFNEHKVFRLGDFVSSNDIQFFERVEQAGYSVGAISPMNASNKMKNPAYFIPDPWTKTESDGSYLSKTLSKSISQAVNDNSQSKLTFTTLLNLTVAFFALVRPRKFISLIFYALSSYAKPWRKALFLDKLLHEVHQTYYRRRNPNFSVLFLNAGAHIQHHCFLNSTEINAKKLKNPSWYINDEDPVKEMLIAYDDIINDILNLKSTEIIIATGLSQKPYEENKFYYRLKNHKNFLDGLQIKYMNVIPRMTRDFLITFESLDDLNHAKEKLAKINVNDIPLFNEIDNRGKDLFVVLTYGLEITKETKFNVNSKLFNLYKMVTFVAIKNGEHQSKGFSYFSDGIKHLAPQNNSHVSKIFNTVVNYFEA